MLVWTLLGLALAALALRAMFPLPDMSCRAEELQVPDQPSPLADRIAATARDHPGKTGLVLLPTGIEAFAGRCAQVRSATRTIDAQYYIWHGDRTGRLLLADLIAAADRGVRVRLLIDDNPTAGLDGMWAAVSTHPRISVRMFNPLTIRRPRVFNYLFSAFRLNRRMHNKSLTIDNAITIVGGRNVGDEYFDASDDGLFIDLDAMAVGAVVDDVSADFERYWTSASSFPAEIILARAKPDSIDRLRDVSDVDSPKMAKYRQAAEEIIAELSAPPATDGLVWTDVRLVSDNPDKALERSKRSDLLAVKIRPEIATARTRFDLVSGYFVPSRDGMQLIGGLARRGVAVRVITNSFAVTDVPLVHAGYAPRRKPLLKLGVRLFEARPLATVRRPRGEIKKTRFSGGGESVHAKTFTIDNRTLFVGSFNFDPRSALLNCEMGFLIDSPELALGVQDALDERLQFAAYDLSLSPKGSLQWHAGRRDETPAIDVEPNMNAFKRGMVWLMARLPIEWLL